MQYRYDSISVLHQQEHTLRKTIVHDVSGPNQVIQDNGKQHLLITQLMLTSNHQSPQFGIMVQ